MKQQQGFTLIELIIVIVILGILAVTAAPRFIDIQSDARAGVLEGVQGAVQGASQLVYAKAAIAGVQKSDSATVTIGSDTVPVRYGYPDADAITSAAILKRFVDVELGADEDLSFDNSSTSDDILRIFFTRTPSVAAVTTSGSESDATGCHLEYRSATGPGTTPTYTLLTNNC